MTTVLTTAERVDAHGIRRAPNGRPYVTTPEGKNTTYQRCTTFIKTVQDQEALVKWRIRQTFKGLYENPRYFLEASDVASRTETDQTKQQLNKILAEAFEASGAHDRANQGTDLHAIIEAINKGGNPPVPPQYQRHIEAYRKAAKQAGLTVLESEIFTVYDPWQVAGTPDMIVRTNATIGKPFIADIKTGSGARTYGAGALSMQMALYAHSVRYNQADNTREPLQVETGIGVAIFLDAETANCSIEYVDLEPGWEACQVAWGIKQVRQSLTPKKLFNHSFCKAVTAKPDSPAPETDELPDTLLTVPERQERQKLQDMTTAAREAIIQARNHDELFAAYQLAKPVWNSELERLADAKADQLAKTHK